MIEGVYLVRRHDPVNIFTIEEFFGWSAGVALVEEVDVAAEEQPAVLPKMAQVSRCDITQLAEDGGPSVVVTRETEPVLLRKADCPREQAARVLDADASHGHGFSGTI